MSFKIGIVGLPNVGKSTLFNALTKQQVPASNFPFTTINPNVGVIAVPDERIEKLAKLEHSAKLVPTSIEFVDIAGLVKGAAEGAGLGNQFLSHIREVDAIVQIVRFFENKDIIHVEGSVNPPRDVETINLELVLADLASVNKRLEKVNKEAKSGSKESLAKKQVLEKLQKVLEEGRLAKEPSLASEEKELVKDLELLTLKPILYVANVTATTDLEMLYPNFIPIDIKLEAELSELQDSEKQQYLKELGMDESGLDKLIKRSYQLLNLITFFTVGPKEAKAWTVPAGTKAPAAAGKIHTDFEKGFIKAEVISANKLLQAGSYAHAREKGWMRLEGKEYVMADGDVVHFRFNL